MSATESLHFEHLIEINDPGLSAVEAVTRSQLWRGLVLRVEHPQSFMPWLDNCEVHREPDGTLRRVLAFGAERVQDRVCFDFETAIETAICTVAGTFSQRVLIEEPAPGRLFLRFTYTAQSDDHRVDSPYGSAVTDAWRHADRDTVFRIRQLAASGALDR